MNTTTAQNPVKAAKASSFVDELWLNIIRNGFGVWSKNDLSDYLLYLFNKYDENHFFDTNTNEQNERLLKTTASKIKTSKKNIAVKFMSQGEYDSIFEDFLNALSSGKIAIKDSKNNMLEMTIENPVFKSMLEAKLKDSTQEGFEYSLNNEKVAISCKTFMLMLAKEASNLNKNDTLDKILKECKMTKNMQNFNTLLKELAKAPQDFGLSFIAEFVPKIYQALYKNFNKKDKE